MSQQHHNSRSRTGGFWLVQRLRPNDHPSDRSKGFDRHWVLEYMGSAEYEYGTPREALARLRAHGRKLVVQPHEMSMTTSGNSFSGILPGTYEHLVWLVAPRKEQDDRAAAMQAWLNAGARCKEASHFREVFGDTTKDFYLRTKAWWSFSDDVMWSLSEETSQNLLAAIKDGA